MPDEAPILRQIVTRARPRGEQEPLPGGDDAIQRWCETAAGGDAVRFARRLQWRDAGPRREASMSPRAWPEWAELFREAFGGTVAETTARFAPWPLNGGDDRALDPSQAIPFQELLLPLVAVARARLAGEAGDVYDLLDRSAHRALERQLLGRLSWVVARALYASFSVYRSTRLRPVMSLLGGEEGTPGGAVLYEDFLRGMRAGGLLHFFQEYSVAARLCGTAAELWISANAAFLRALSADADALRARFSPATDPGPVTGLRTGIADSHEGGRSVYILTFQSGLRLIYKPRPLELDRWFAGLLDDLAAHTTLLPLKAPAVLCRPTYGWVEFVPAQPCQNAEEVAWFYQRCGVLLAAVYALNGSDFHFENLIACGEQPVLIDLEALLGHRITLGGEPATAELDVADLARQRADASVLRLSLLPSLKVGRRDETADLGGMLGADIPTEAVSAYTWENPGQDSMRLRRVLIPAGVRANNVPELDGRRVDASRYGAEVIEGFTQACRWLMRLRGRLLAPQGLISELRASPVRFLFRDTSLYATLLERCHHPKFLRTGAERSLQLDVLTRPLLARETRPVIWPIVAAEVRALEQLDIPCFAAPAGVCDLPLSDGSTIRGCFDQSAYAQAVLRFRRLSEADIQEQVQLIRGAMAASVRRDLRAEDLPVTIEPPPPASRSERESQERALAAAVRIADLLAAGAVTTSDGQTSWIDVTYLARSRRSVVAPVSPGMFDGATGIAMFLSALAQATGDRRFRELAYGVARPVTAVFGRFAEFSSSQVARGAGGLTGMASALSALAWIAEDLDQPDLLHGADQVLNRVAAIPLDPDGPVDVAAGAAGTVLSLLAFHAATQRARALDHAVALGRYILSRRVGGPTGARGVWLGRGQTAEIGFAHGQSGVGAALLALAGVTHEPLLVDAALESFAAERELRAADPETSALENRRAAWSRGSAGIGFARLAALRLAPTSEVREDLAAALAETSKHLQDGDDALATGVAGRIDLLLEAGAALAEPTLTRLAGAAAAALTCRATDPAGPRSGWSDGYVHRGLFQGLAGIGYQLLRLARPGEVRSVLSLAGSVARREASVR